MERRYIAIDVETPNHHNDRMSAIGLTVIDKGKIAEQFYTLVNPETQFEPFNVMLTGITPEMVADQPAFPAVWQKIAPWMNDGLLIAHNAPFDMAVLAKCLKRYGIVWRPYVPYVCTCQMGRRLLPELPNHKLDTLCRYWNLSLNHHHAGSDSLACGEILLCYLRSGADVAPFVRTYDMANTCTLKPQRPRRRAGEAR